MNQPAQQQNKQQQPQVDRHWKFVIQSGDVDFATRARRYVQTTYGSKVKVTTTLNAHVLSEQSIVVVLFKDPRRDITDKVTKEQRPRRMPTGYGKDKTPGEKCEVLQTQPIKCDRFYREGRGEDQDGVVALTSWKDSKGVEHDGLLAALTKACSSEPGRAGPVRCQYDDRNHVIQVWST